MDRGEFLKRAGAISLGAFTLPFTTSFTEPPGLPVSRPNIILIITDDQPFRTMSYMTQTEAALGQGLKFNRAYVASPLCGPSRVSLMTGMYPHNHKLRVNDHIARRFRNDGWAQASIGYWLSAVAGYDCGYYGKFLNQYEEIASWQPRSYRGWISTFTDATPVKANVQGTIRKPRPGGSLVARRDETSYIADKALQFMAEDHEGKPFFCVASVSAPHHPYNPSLAHEGEFANVAMPHPDNFDAYDPNKPAWIRDPSPMTSGQKAEMQTDWRGMMEELMDVDDAVAEICAAVDFEETYVFFMTDNGYMLGEHRLFKKGMPYEESTRTPLYVRGPGVRENATSDLLVGNADFAATILDIAGLDTNEYDLDGRSFVGPMFTPDESALIWRDNLLVEQPTHFGYVDAAWHALRTATDLYVSYETGDVERYDTSIDPYELTNIVGADPVRDYELSQKLGELTGATGSTLRSAEMNS